MSRPVQDHELIATTDRLISQAIDYIGTGIAEDRRRLMQAYLCEPVGDFAPPEVDGRSAVVSSDVADTVEWMLPNLMRIFAAGDRVVEFVARRHEDEEAARQATEYVNHVFYAQNSGFQLLMTWFRDALMQRVGVLKVTWDASLEDIRESYTGLTDVQVQVLASDEAVTIVEHSAAPDPAAQVVDPSAPVPMLHDVVVTRSRPRDRVRIDAVPPDEFLISRGARSIEDAKFVAHRVERTLSDLRAAGYANVDQIGGEGDDSTAFDMEREAREGEIDIEDDPADESQRSVWVTECYLRADRDGDGIAEWRRVVRAGGVILADDECDGPPFVSITPIPMAHRFFGLCPADQAYEIQRVKTSLWRASLDGLYASINGRTFAVENQVNMDDLLTTRPGGVVRVKSPGMVGPLGEGRPDLAAAQSMMEQAEMAKEARTGWTRYSQGNAADSLNPTATGINIITNKADQRVELIARVFAETGVRDLFQLILKLVSQHQKRAEVVRIAGKWVEYDPRQWATSFDFAANVGLGTGNKDQQVQRLMALIQAQQQAAGAGLAGPQEAYRSLTRLAEALGFQNADQFFRDPSRQPAQPQPSNPQMLQLQMEQQKAAAELQAKQAKLQADMRLQAAKLEMDRERMAAELQMARERMAAEIQMARERMAVEMSAAAAGMRPGGSPAV